MELQTLLNAVVSNGLGNVLAIAIALGAWRLISFVFKENARRETAYLKIVEEQNSKIIVSLEEARRHNENEQQQHNKMIETLDRINQSLSQMR